MLLFLSGLLVAAPKFSGSAGLSRRRGDAAEVAGFQYVGRRAQLRGGPSATTRPRLSTYARSATLSAAPTCCSTSRTASCSSLVMVRRTGSSLSSTTGARPWLSSSMSSRRGLRRQRAAEAEHLLLPAGQQAGLAPGERPQCREVAEDLVGAVSGSPRRCRSRRFSATVSWAKIPRLSGTSAAPIRATWSGRLPGGRLAEDLDLAAHRGQLAGDAEHRGGLACAVRAEERHQLAGLDVQADPVQRRRVPVSGGQVGDAQRGLRHRPPPALAPGWPGIGDQRLAGSGCVAQVGGDDRRVGAHRGRRPGGNQLPEVQNVDVVADGS